MTTFRRSTATVEIDGGVTEPSLQRITHEPYGPADAQRLPADLHRVQRPLEAFKRREVYDISKSIYADASESIQRSSRRASRVMSSGSRKVLVRSAIPW